VCVVTDAKGIKVGSCWNCSCSHPEIGHFVIASDFSFQTCRQFSVHHDPGVVARQYYVVRLQVKLMFEL
jgi:hypothetical protein